MLLCNVLGRESNVCVFFPLPSLPPSCLFARDLPPLGYEFHLETPAVRLSRLRRHLPAINNLPLPLSSALGCCEGLVRREEEEEGKFKVRQPIMF